MLAKTVHLEPQKFCSLVILLYLSN